MDAPVPVSSSYIGEQQSAVEATLADLERRAQGLAFAAVGGDAEAVAELADVDAQIGRAKADALVFQRAKATADRIEAEAAEEAAAAKRAEHRVEAEQQAVAFVGLVEQADAAITAFVGIVQRVRVTENDLRKEIRAAGINLDSVVAGRSGVAGLVLGRLHVAVGPEASYRHNPPVADRARAAWDFLIRNRGRAMSDIEAAYVLFPSDAPPAQAPDWYAAQRAAAETRLSGLGRAASEPDAAAKVFPSEAKQEGAAVEKLEGDMAAALFKDEAVADYDKLVSGELDQPMIGAIQDGDTERADALKSATTALASDFKSSGTPAEELKEAFAIVRQSAGLTPPTPEQREVSYAEGLAAIQSEGATGDELNAARAFIRDLEIVSPGVVASLNAHGAGNDPKLIRAAIKEAKRRGYR